MLRQRVRRFFRIVCGLSQAMALRLVLRLVARLLVVVVWVVALLGAARATLAVMQDSLRLFALVAICVAVSALAIVLVAI